MDEEFDGREQEEDKKGKERGELGDRLEWKGKQERNRRKRLYRGV